jgi:hypothetical protein
MTPSELTGIGSVLLAPGTCEPIVTESGCVRCDVVGATSARVASSRDDRRALAYAATCPWRSARTSPCIVRASG